MSRKLVVFVLAFGLCLSLTLTSNAATVVSILAEGDLFDQVGSVQFDILSPGSASASNFDNNFPAGWFNFSGGKLISAFDGGGTSPLKTGIIGTFDLDVVLGGWALGNQAGQDLELGVDFLVKLVGSNYEITPVPIPSAILLLGGGLLSLVAVRRRRT